jgi:hypothetical protein
MISREAPKSAPGKVSVEQRYQNLTGVRHNGVDYADAREEAEGLKHKRADARKEAEKDACAEKLTDTEEYLHDACWMELVNRVTNTDSGAISERLRLAVQVTAEKLTAWNQYETDCKTAGVPVVEQDRADMAKLFRQTRKAARDAFEHVQRFNKRSEHNHSSLSGPDIKRAFEHVERIEWWRENVFDPIKGGWKFVSESIYEIAKPVIEPIKSFVKQYVVEPIIKPAVEVAKTYAVKAKKGIESAAKQAVGCLKEAGSWLWSTGSWMAGTMKEAVIDPIIMKVVKPVTNFVGKALAPIGTAIMENANTVQKALAPVVKMVAETVWDLSNRVATSDAVQWAWRQARSVLSKAWKFVQAMWKKAMDLIKYVLRTFGSPCWRVWNYFAPSWLKAFLARAAVEILYYAPAFIVGVALVVSGAAACLGFAVFGTILSMATMVAPSMIAPWVISASKTAWELTNRAYVATAKITKGVWQKLASRLSSAWEWSKLPVEYCQRALSALYDVCSSAWIAIKDRSPLWLKSLCSFIHDYILDPLFVFACCAVVVIALPFAILGACFASPFILLYYLYKGSQAFSNLKRHADHGDMSMYNQQELGAGWNAVHLSHGLSDIEVQRVQALRKVAGAGTFGWRCFFDPSIMRGLKQLPTKEEYQRIMKLPTAQREAELAQIRSTMSNLQQVDRRYVAAHGEIMKALVYVAQALAMMGSVAALFCAYLFAPPALAFIAITAALISTIGTAVAAGLTLLKEWVEDSNNLTRQQKKKFKNAISFVDGALGFALLGTDVMSFHLQRMALAAANTAAALTTRAVKFVGSAQKRFLRKQLQLQTAQRVVAAPQSIQQKAQKLDAAAGDSAAVNDMVDDDNGEWANLGVAANALNIGMDAAALGWTVYAATASTAANSSGVDTQAIEETGWTNPATGAGAGVVVTAAAAVALAVGVNLAAAAALCAVVAVARGLIHVTEKAAAAQVAADAQEKKQKNEEREKKEKEEREKKEKEEREKKEKEEREKREKEEREKKEKEERERKEKEEREKKETEERNGRLRTYALIGGVVILSVAVGSIVYASGGTAAPVADVVVQQAPTLVQNSIGQWYHSATGWFASKATVANEGLTWVGR